MVLATIECFNALKKTGVKITPAKLNFYFLPTVILAPIFMMTMNTQIAEYSMAKHTMAAKEELEVLEEQFRSLFINFGCDMKHFNEL